MKKIIQRSDPYQDVKQFLIDKNLILASNRGPVEFYKENGLVKTRKGSGGLVSTLFPLMENINGKWVAAALNPVDIEVAGKYSNNIVPVPEENPQFYMPFLTFQPEVYNDYYNIISNSVLWYVHHYLWTPPRSDEDKNQLRKSWENGYKPVNYAFARQINQLIDPSKQNIVMLHDYHLYLTASHITNKNREDAVLTQFIHVPWPRADYFSILPDYMKYPILDSLLANDIIGFHIPRYVDNFLECSQEIADEVDSRNKIIHYQGRTVHVKYYPISIDTNGLKELKSDSKVGDNEKFIHEIKGGKFLIYRTDRADLSKNIIRGFEAYDLFLENYPEYQGKVVFLATSKSTRSNLPDYRKYRSSIEDLIEKINNKYSSNDWKPIVEVFNAPYHLVVAALKNYDCLLVNPICDGMNIVSKEGSFLNEKNGVVILSQEAGSHYELQEHVISVDPFDIKETAEAIHKAVTMKNEERMERCNGLKELIGENTLSDWISGQFMDIKDLMGKR